MTSTKGHSNPKQQKTSSSYDNKQRFSQAMQLLNTLEAGKFEQFDKGLPMLVSPELMNLMKRFSSMISARIKQQEQNYKQIKGILFLQLQEIDKIYSKMTPSKNKFNSLLDQIRTLRHKASSQPQLKQIEIWLDTILGRVPIQKPKQDLLAKSILSKLKEIEEEVNAGRKFMFQIQKAIQGPIAAKTDIKGSSQLSASQLNNEQQNLSSAHRQKLSAGQKRYLDSIISLQQSVISEKQQNSRILSQKNCIIQTKQSQILKLKQQLDQQGKIASRAQAQKQKHLQLMEKDNVELKRKLSQLSTEMATVKLMRNPKESQQLEMNPNADQKLNTIHSQLQGLTNRNSLGVPCQIDKGLQVQLENTINTQIKLKSKMYSEQAKINSLSQEIDHYKTTVKQLSQSSNAKILQLQTQIQNLNRQKTQHQQALVEKNHQFSLLTIDNHNKQATIQALNKDAKNNAQKLEQQHLGKQQQVEKMRKELSSVLQEKHQLQTKTVCLGQSNSELQKVIVHLKKDMENTVKSRLEENQQKNSQIDLLKNELDNQKCKNGRISKFRQELKKNLQYSQSKQKLMQKQLIACQQKLKLLQQQSESRDKNQALIKAQTILPINQPEKVQRTVFASDDLRRIQQLESENNKLRNLIQSCNQKVELEQKQKQELKKTLAQSLKQRQRLNQVVQALRQNEKSLSNLHLRSNVNSIAAQTAFTQEQQQNNINCRNQNQIENTKTSALRQIEEFLKKQLQWSQENADQNILLSKILRFSNQLSSTNKEAKENCMHLLSQVENLSREKAESQWQRQKNQQLLIEEYQKRRQLEERIKSYESQKCEKEKNNERLKAKIEVLQMWKIKAEEALENRRKELIVLKQCQNYRRNITRLFVGSQVIEQHSVQNKEFVLESIKKQQGRDILNTQLLYRFDPLNQINFHEYFRNKTNILLLVRTARGTLVGGFMEGPISQTSTGGRGFIFSVTKKQVYSFNTKNNYRANTYDPYYIIYGNGQLRIKACDKNNALFSNFGIINSYFDPRGHTVVDFLGQPNMGQKPRETRYIIYEIYHLDWETI